VWRKEGGKKSNARSGRLEKVIKEKSPSAPLVARLKRGGGTGNRGKRHLQKPWKKKEGNHLACWRHPEGGGKKKK